MKISLRMNRARWIAVGVVVVAAGAVVYFARPRPLPVDTAAITRRALETTIDADGRTRVRERYVVVAPVAGRLERVSRDEGSPVRAGDVVARIAPMPLDSQATAQARARVDAAMALSLEAAAQSSVAKAALAQRRQELTRAERLAEVGGVAPRVVEEARLAVIEAEAALTAATERSRAADADVRAARAPLLGLTAKGEATVLVRAPASGRVLRVPERSERIVAAGTTLLEIGNPSSLEIVVDLLSSDAATVHPGDRVRLAGWATDGNGETSAAGWGRVREIEPSGFTKVSALGVDEQRVNVIVEPRTVPATVGDAFRVEASIIVWSAPNVITVPRSSLLQSGDAWTVFLVRGGRVERRVVRVGHLAGAAAEVLAGVGVGDEVVVFPSDRVAPGIRVARRGD